MPGALGLLAFLDATYLAGPVHFGRHGEAAAYWPFVVGVSVLLTMVFLVVGRAVGRRSAAGPDVDALLVGLGSVVALHLVDLVTGAHLEWNTVFGYSPTIGIRFVGQGNLTFAQLVGAAVLFAGLAAWRVRPPWGVRVAILVLAVTVVVMAAPVWGNDFGVGALRGAGVRADDMAAARAPATVRSAVGVVSVAVTAVIAVGLVDLLRPAEDRTHVGKFFVKLFDDADAATRDPAQGLGEPLGARPLGTAGHGDRGRLADRLPLVQCHPGRCARSRAHPDVGCHRSGIRRRRGVGVHAQRLRGHHFGMMFAVLEATIVVLLAEIVMRPETSGDR